MSIEPVRKSARAMLLKKQSPSRKKRGTSRWVVASHWVEKVAKVLLLLLPVAAAVPVLVVLAVRWVDPGFSPMMVQRWIEARLDRSTPATVRREWTDLEEVPVRFLHFVLVAEDQRFFQHDGIDWIEVRAALASAGPSRGASTITMQCARSAFLWQGRSRVRKAAEVYFTFWMERLLSKRRILELYVNSIEMGDGIYGLASASRHYFGKEPGDLSDHQLALLAGMLPNPREWDPRKPGPALEARQKRIRLRAPGWRFPEGWDQ